VLVFVILREKNAKIVQLYKSNPNPNPNCQSRLIR